MPHYVASDLGLQFLPMTLLRVSRLEWVKSRSRNSKLGCTMGMRHFRQAILLADSFIRFLRIYGL